MWREKMNRKWGMRLLVVGALGLIAIFAIRWDLSLKAPPATSPLDVLLSNSPTDIANSKLMGAVRRGDPSAVKAALAHGSSVESTDFWGWDHNAGASALTLAAERGDDPIVQLLLDAGADVSRRDGHGRPPIVAAAGAGNLSTVQLLLNRGEIATAAAADGETALHAAAARGHIEMIDFLLKAGVPVDIPDQSSRTPLYRAAQSAKVTVVEHLLAHGAAKSSSSPDSPSRMLRQRIAQSEQDHALYAVKNNWSEEEYQAHLKPFLEILALLESQ